MNITNLTSDTYQILGRHALLPNATITISNSEYQSPPIRDSINSLYKQNKISVSDEPFGFPVKGSKGYIVDPVYKNNGDILTWDDDSNSWIADSGGSGSITEVTSDDDSVTITGGTGPTVDLSVSTNGGSQPDGAQLSKDFLFTEEATMGSESYPITAVEDPDPGTFTIAGDHVDDFIICDWFAISGSTGNDGIFGISDVQLVDGDTVITTTDSISDPTVDGDIWPSQYRATMALPADTVIDDVIVYPLATWAADTVALFVFDESNLPDAAGVFISNSIDAIDPYDTHSVQPAAAGPGGNYATSSGQQDGAAGAGRIHAEGATRYPGPGARYLTTDTLHLTVVTLIASPPVVPTGLTKVTVLYRTPQTPTDAVFT